MATTLKQEKLSSELAQKHMNLQKYFHDLGSVVVAFSGGIDSSLVAYIAYEVLKEKMLAVTSGSDSLKREDLELTKHLAQKWGIPHQIVYTNELENSNYVSNPTNRCYYCKTTLYQTIANVVRDREFQHIVNGTNQDDLGDFRPGLVAAKEHSVLSPLVDCQMNKLEIRELAGFLGLENSQKPQAACLSSRIPHGIKVSKNILGQIERAESILSRLGFTQCRVRHHQSVARIEILAEEFELAMRNREEIEKRIKDCGYRYVTLDLGGFRSGSLNPIPKE